MSLEVDPIDNKVCFDSMSRAIGRPIKDLQALPPNSNVPSAMMRDILPRLSYIISTGIYAGAMNDKAHVMPGGNQVVPASNAFDRILTREFYDEIVRVTRESIEKRALLEKKEKRAEKKRRSN
jgi:hypothetical protein